MYKYVQVIYPMLRIVARSMIIYLYSLDKKGGRICIDTTLVNGFTYIYLYVNTMRLWVVWKQMCDPYAYFDFILIYICTVQIKVTQFKVREEASGSAAYVLIKPS